MEKVIIKIYSLRKIEGLKISYNTMAKDIEKSVKLQKLKIMSSNRQNLKNLVK